MCSQLITMITLLAACTFALGARGESQRKLKSSEQDPTKIVQSLLATHQAKQEILMQIQYQTPARRKQIASELAKIVADPQSHRQRPESVKAAISLLGELRATEGVDALATHIGFPFIYHPQAGRPPFFGVGILYRLEASLPAIPALVSIGEPCIDAVVAKISKTDRVLEQNACIRVLKALSPRSKIREKLQNAISKVPPRRRLALQVALNDLDRKAIYSKTVQLLLPENLKNIRTRQELRNAKQQIVRKWKQRTAQEKKRMTSELSRIVADPENHVYQGSSVREAMNILGEFRDLDAIPVLVEYIGFPSQQHPDVGHTPILLTMSQATRPIEETHPAVPALINIGPSCIDAVIAKISSTDNILEHKACTVVLKKLRQPSTRAKLEKALAKTVPRRRYVLRNAIKSLDEKPTSSKK